MTNKPLIIAAIALMATTLSSELNAATAYSTMVSNDAPTLYWSFDEASGDAKQIMPTQLPPPPPAITNCLSPGVLGDHTVGRISHDSIASGLKLGNAADFQLEGDFFGGDLSVSNLGALPPPYAIEFWMQVQDQIDSPRNDYLMSFAQSDRPAVLFDYNEPAGRLGIGMYSGTPFGSISANSPPIADTANWHHIVIAYYGDGASGVADRLSVYIDGTNSTPDSIRVYFPNPAYSFRTPLTLSHLTVGAGSENFGGGGFVGRMDELAIYDLRSLPTESEVTAKVSQVASGHYSVASTAASPNAYSQAVLTDTPILYWNFNEADGVAVQQVPYPSTVQQPNDLRAWNGAARLSHSTLVSGLELGIAADFPQATPVPVFLGTLQGVPNSLAAPYAIEFWMQAQGGVDPSTTPERNDYVMAFGDDAVLYDYNAPAGRLGLGLYAPAGNISGNSPAIADNNWHHVIIAYYGDGTTGVADRLSVYIDGTNSTPDSIRVYAPAPSLHWHKALNLASQVAIGAAGVTANSASDFFGRLDEVAVYGFPTLTDEAQMTAKVADLASRHFAAAQGAPRPSLAILKSGQNIVISWSSASTGYQLQVAPTLNGGWASAGGTPALVGGNWQVSIPLPTTNQFFRLIK